MFIFSKLFRYLSKLYNLSDPNRLVLIVRQTVIVFQNRVDESVNAADRDVVLKEFDDVG